MSTVKPWPVTDAGAAEPPDPGTAPPTPRRRRTRRLSPTQAPPADRRAQVVARYRAARSQQALVDDGLACVVCGLDYLTHTAPVHVPVGYCTETGSQVFACATCCGEE